MEEVDTTEDSRQMLVFTHSLNLSVAEEAISNSFPKISSTPKFCRPKIPHPCLSSNQKSHRLPIPPTPGTADPHRSCCPSRAASELPPCIPALPRPLTTSRPVESLLAAVRKREKKAQPDHQLATIPTRTPVAKTPQLTRPQVSSPSRTCPIAASLSKTRPHAPKLIPIPIAPQTTPHATDTPHPSQCPTRRRRPSPRRQRRRARSPGPSARLFSTRRSVLHPRADPSRETPLRATVDR